MKRISVKQIGSQTDPFTIQVNPGDTAGEILSQLNLEGYVLAIPPAPNRYFAGDEQVYEELLDGDYLLAVAKRSTAIEPDKAREDLSKLLEIADEEPMKTLTIRVYGSKRPPIHIQIQPETKTSHVLAYLKLPGYALIPAGTTENLAKEIFKNLNPAEDDLYERVQDGTKLVALPPIEAARLGFADLLKNSPLKEFIR